MPEQPNDKELEAKIEPTSSAFPTKAEPKKGKQSESIKAVFPPYAGQTCPVCNSKKVTDNSGQYICPITPQPSDCPVK